LEKLQAEAGTGSVMDIAGRVGEIPSQTEAPPASLATDLGSGQSKQSWAELVSHTAMIQDPSIRERLREVISRYPAQGPPRPAKGPSQVP
jgi:hypothetical protein